MRAPPSVQVKLATEEWEFEAIHRLNYRTFVEEIPQHAPNGDGRLVDRFHAENSYVIAREGSRVVGMLAIRGKRPFSLDAKVPALDGHLPEGRRPVEVRLLAVEPAFRRTSVFVALFEFATRKCLADGFDLAVISGTTRELKLYRHLGFAPFGPLVGSDGAQYQPMYLTLDALNRTTYKSLVLREAFKENRSTPNGINLLPGPVLTTQEVDQAFSEPAISHRSPVFLAEMRHVRAQLCELTGARDVQVIPGSGSLANAVVAAQLSLLGRPGVVMSNGAFGDRLASDSRRAGLDFTVFRQPWGASFGPEQIEEASASLAPGGWIWAVHHETSTGVLNPIEPLKSVARRKGLHLCLDCVSSMGAVPVDLRDVYLATGTSGKGLGGYPGLGLVFHDFAPKPAPDRIPGYLDLGHWAENSSVPHTHSSNLTHALCVALRAVTPERMEQIRVNTAWLRRRLLDQGWRLTGEENSPGAGVITLALENPGAATALGETLEHRGYWLNFRSGHLYDRNWIQVSLLGNPPRSLLERFLETLGTLRPGGGPASRDSASAGRVLATSEF
ncbi:MAG: aminotransferase class V-fold PLP-dependent enzyme [Opitutaceae bacterium]|nr:aminotransferase class V-fold PLP-dependent enzyme [Opitutaceae bacterium]